MGGRSCRRAIPLTRSLRPPTASRTASLLDSEMGSCRSWCTCQDGAVSTGDVLALLTAIAAAASVVVALLVYRSSAVSFNTSIASPASIDMKIGQDIALHYSERGRLYLRADFAFINRGAQPAALVQITGTLRDLQGRVAPIEMHWSTFEDSIKRETWVSGSTGTVRTLVIPGRAAGPAGVVERIRLISLRSLSEGPARADRLPIFGRLSLELIALIDFADKPVPPYNCELHINETDAKALNTDCVEKEVKDSQGRPSQRWEYRLFLLRLEPGASPGADVFQSQPRSKLSALENYRA